MFSLVDILEVPILPMGEKLIFSTGYFRPTASTVFISLRGNKETRELIGSLMERSFGK